MDLLSPHILDTSQDLHLTDLEIDEQVQYLTEVAQTPEAAQKCLPAAFALIRSAPNDPRPQLLAATMLERSRERENMLDTWAALFDRFPHLDSALRFLIRWLNRAGRTQEAVNLLQHLFEDESQSEEALAAQAEIYAEIRDPDAADILFQQLLERCRQNVRIRVIYGKSLFARGEILRAFEILDPVRGANLSSTAKSVVERNDRAILAMESIRPNSSSAIPSGPDALFNAISLFRNRSPRTTDPDCIKGVSFYTGSLGAGGAERQLTQIARALHDRARTGRKIGGTSIAGGVEVIVNSTDTASGKDFFRAELEESNVPLSITQDMPASTKHIMPEQLAILKDLLPILPANARFGLERLVGHLKRRDPDVLYIWQDGAVLTGALAALVAGVPRIAISFRGLPPNLRPHLMKPEYHKLYQALQGIPGVSFSCNSHRGAIEYCRWLGVPNDRFSVLYNALLPLADDPKGVDLEQWTEFQARTLNASFTLGGVFRMTPNKRGLTWIEFAAASLKRHPDMRFILVGSGIEMDAMRAKAAVLGIEQRVLFVGRSDAPGFWYDKMDAVALLSENEGLPNVLIEAQSCGKPVISTPAGGAQETFAPGRTGYLLSSAANPDQAEFLTYLDQLVMDRDGSAAMGQSARELAHSRFSFNYILSQTIEHFRGAIISSDKPAASNVTPIQRSSFPQVAAPRVQEAYNIFASH